MITDLRFSNFNKDTTPVVQGIVKTVGADKEPVANPSEAGEFYMAQVEVTPEGLRELGALKIQPGMSVDVIVKSGTRSFMSYLLKPIVDKAAKSFQ
jgi:protease secretion system membrane fusion protein